MSIDTDRHPGHLGALLSTRARPPGARIDAATALFVLCPQAQTARAVLSGSAATPCCANAHRAPTSAWQAGALLGPYDLAAGGAIRAGVVRTTRRRTHGASIASLNAHAVGAVTVVTTGRTQPAMLRSGGAAPIAARKACGAIDIAQAAVLAAPVCGDALLTELESLTPKPLRARFLRTVASAKRAPELQVTDAVVIAPTALRIATT